GHRPPLQPAETALKNRFELRLDNGPPQEVDPLGDGAVLPGGEPAGPLARDAVDVGDLLEGADERGEAGDVATEEGRLPLATPRQEAEANEDVRDQGDEKPLAPTRDLDPDRRSLRRQLLPPVGEKLEPAAQDPHAEDQEHRVERHVMMLDVPDLVAEHRLDL